MSRIGQLLDGRFRIDAAIGRGAMAEVYQALDLQTSAFVALKVLRHTAVEDAVSLARFAREAEVQGKLRHRNVAALLATGVTDKHEPYLALELLRGKSLRSVLKAEGRIQPRRAVHEAGVLHRDLKPANIMLEPSPGPVDRVVLIDFGFATFEGSAKLTLQGTVVGSLTYIAPERLRGEPTDQRADLYAIGVILYELLAGRPPFTAADDFDLIEQHLHVHPPRLQSLDPELPAALDDVLGRALEKQPAQRFGDALEMAAALELAAQRIV
jgi:eukaryotic-like serine/threonine-protein kinase